MQANRKHSAKNRCAEKSATVWVSPCKQTASEQIKQRREIPTKTQAGPANHDRGTRIKNSRSEGTGNRRKGGVVLQANCKQWVQERPGSVRNPAVAGNAKDQVRIYFLPLGSAQGHSKYHPKWLFKSPLRHQFWRAFPQVSNVEHLGCSPGRAKMVRGSCWLAASPWGRSGWVVRFGTTPFPL